jgi:hypothetical protein
MGKITTPHGVILECVLVIGIIGYISKAETLSMEKLKVNGQELTRMIKVGTQTCPRSHLE